MESKSKLRLDHAQLEKMVKKAFGGDTRLLSAEENREGWYNALYSLTLSGMGEVFLKAAPPESVPCLRYEKDIIKTEIAVLKLFHKQADIPAPEVLFEDESHGIIESDYFIMEKLEGSSYLSKRNDLSPGITAQIDEEKGRINRSINLIKGDSFGLFSPEAEAYPTWKEAFTALIDNILADAEEFGASFPLSPEKISEELRKRSACLDSVTEPCLIHWDLHDGNILVREDNSISGIIDCDRAMWGDPAIEFYHSTLFPSNQDFYRGYGESLPEEETFPLRRELYDLYLTLIFVTECQSRGIEDINHRGWAEAMLKEQLKRMKILS